MLMASYTEQDIERSIRTVASLIDRFGEAYWPILERLEQELESRRSRVARLQRYLEVNGPCAVERTGTKQSYRDKRQIHKGAREEQAQSLERQA